MKLRLGDCILGAEMASTGAPGAVNRKRKDLTDDSSSDEDEIDRAEFSDEEGGIRIDDIYIPPPPRNACNSESNAPRLIITRIVNENFKSYAGQQILGPFHKVTIKSHNLVKYD